VFPSVIPLASLDGATAVWVATHRWAPLDDPFVVVGDLDRLGAIWIVLALCVGLVRRTGALRTLGLGLVVALATFAADSVSFGVKDLAHRTRPFVAHPEIHPLYKVHSSSFPAGHAATSFAGATLLACLAPRAAPFFLGLAATISFSRVYVGVHYPSDVLAGAAIGVLIGLLSALLVALVPERISRLRRWDGVGDRSPPLTTGRLRSRGLPHP
jgi:undecaprenyl-diphosphatase